MVLSFYEAIPFTILIVLRRKNDIFDRTLLFEVSPYFLDQNNGGNIGNKNNIILLMLLRTLMRLSFDCGLGRVVV